MGTQAVGTAWIYDAVRTPIGKAGGALAGVRPDDLAAGALRGLVGRHPDLDPAAIDDVWFGDANGAGEDNRDVARMAVLLAGLPPTVPGVTVNRLCGSGAEAVVGAARAIECGDAELAVAGGVESMSRAPWVLLKPGRAYPVGNEVLHSTTLGWRMVNPAMPPEWTVALGEGAELIAQRWHISREAQDEWAARSHHRADEAWRSGRLAGQTVAVAGVDLDRDEGIRPGAAVAQLAGLRPVFRPEGSVTAGNASQLSDGAAAVVLGSAAAGDRHGLAPLARIASRAVVANEPQWFGVAPVAAAERALARAGIGWADLDVVELNEAFAAQALGCLAQWPELDPAIVNPNGGAIAMGHPLGCSGARLVGAVAHELVRTGGRWGLATLCIGVGQGIAVVVEGPGRR